MFCSTEFIASIIFKIKNENHLCSNEIGPKFNNSINNGYKNLTIKMAKNLNKIGFLTYSNFFSSKFTPSKTA